MKSSARNQFKGTVTAIGAGAINDQVEIDAGGLKLVAVITRGSTEELGLKVGATAFALVKASSVILVTEDGDVKFSARNRIQGTVSAIDTGAVNTEVTLALPAGGALTAIVTNHSATALGLAVGSPVTGLFKASSVIVGVPA
jgi:molybdate transport system regulatory protein